MKLVEKLGRPLTDEEERQRRADSWQTTEKSALISEEKVVRKGNLFMLERICMKYDKKKAIDIIINAAQNYQKFLQDKTLLITEFIFV